MTREEINTEAQNIVLIHGTLQNAFNQAQTMVNEETIQKYASGIYIKLNPNKGGGSFQKNDVPKELQRGASNNQVKQVGYPCDWCNQPLKQSSKGNAYCPCWFKADPNKQ